MKLLFDENLSPKLVKCLADLFPGSTHVETVGLDATDDVKVWEFARRETYAIVTKDEDFGTISVLRGVPPKIIWLQIGNCTTAKVESAIRSRFAEIAAFEQDPSVGTLVLG